MNIFKVNEGRHEFRKFLETQISNLNKQRNNLGDTSDYEFSLLVSETLAKLELSVKDQLYTPFHCVASEDWSNIYSFDPVQQRGVVEKLSRGKYVILFELDHETANSLRGMERELALEKGVLVKRVPHFEKQFVDVFVVKTDQENFEEYNQIQSMTLTTLIQTLINLSTENIEIDFLYRKLTKGKQARIDLPFGKKLHARD